MQPEDQRWCIDTRSVHPCASASNTAQPLFCVPLQAGSFRPSLFGPIMGLDGPFHSHEGGQLWIQEELLSAEGKDIPVVVKLSS